MKTALLTIGTEILFGQVTNTNATFLSKELQGMGFDVMYHYTCGDNPVRLRGLIDHAFEDCDLILTTGGLGPTQDDLTKETICKYFGDELIEFPEITEWLKNRFKANNYKFTENNLKQAYFPSKSHILANPNGTAPGFWMEVDGKMIMSMPGPPREMIPMFLNEIKPVLFKKMDASIYSTMIRTINIGESSLETVLLPLIDGQTDPTIATYAKEGECSLRVTSKRKTYEEAKSACLEMVDKVNELIGDYIYSYEDEELVSVVGKLLIEKNITISSCESCTAGYFSKQLTDVPGISKVFERGIATYTWRAKQEELGVKLETLEKYTAESPEVAKEMAEGLYKKTGSDICISVTGVAGPDDIDENRPAGLAYCGITYKGETKVVKLWHKSYGREHNRYFFCLRMFNEIYQLIK